MTPRWTVWILLGMMLLSIVLAGCAQQQQGGGNMGGSNAPMELPEGTVAVGSNKSNIYHEPTCAAVGRIAAENRVYFNSIEEAQDAGMKADTACAGPSQ